jgi:hypothetical protein
MSFVSAAVMRSFDATVTGRTDASDAFESGGAGFMRPLSVAPQSLRASSALTDLSNRASQLSAH